MARRKPRSLRQEEPDELIGTGLEEELQSVGFRVGEVPLSATSFHCLVEQPVFADQAGEEVVDEEIPERLLCGGIPTDTEEFPVQSVASPEEGLDTMIADLLAEETQSGSLGFLPESGVQVHTWKGQRRWNDRCRAS